MLFFPSCVFALSQKEDKRDMLHFPKKKTNQNGCPFPWRKINQGCCTSLKRRQPLYVTRFPPKFPELNFNTISHASRWSVIQRHRTPAPRVTVHIIDHSSTSVPQKLSFGSAAHRKVKGEQGDLTVWFHGGRIFHTPAADLSGELFFLEGLTCAKARLLNKAAARWRKSSRRPLLRVYLQIGLPLFLSAWLLHPGLASCIRKAVKGWRLIDLGKDDGQLGTKIRSTF